MFPVKHVLGWDGCLWPSTWCPRRGGLSVCDVGCMDGGRVGIGRQLDVIVYDRVHGKG